jgi:membrane carboxypeptidase/penicillin-binding protein
VKRLHKTWLRVPAFLAMLLLAYLATAAIWAWSVFDAAVQSSPPAQTVRLSDRQLAILLRVEDPSFYDHAGLSIGQGQGVATISSAVARELFLGDGRLEDVSGMFQTFYRGVFDCCKRIDLGRDVMALVLDARMPKREQLARYVARVYMGRHEGRQLSGLGQAARSYLGKPVEAATDEEFVRLVAMIKAPNHYHPTRNPAALAQRAARIQALLRGACEPDGWFDTDFAACAAAALQFKSA